MDIKMFALKCTKNLYGWLYAIYTHIWSQTMHDKCDICSLHLVILRIRTVCIVAFFMFLFLCSLSLSVSNYIASHELWRIRADNLAYIVVVAVAARMGEIVVRQKLKNNGML